MNLFSEFSRYAPNKIALSIVLGGLSGLLYSLLIPLMLSVIEAPNDHLQTVADAPVHLLSLEIANAPFAMVFALTCLFVMATRTLSQVMLTRVAIDVASGLRTQLYDRIADAPLAALERIGSARLIAALTSDVPRIVQGARTLPDVLVNIVTLIGMLGFLLVLNSDVFWYVIGCIVFGVVTFQVPMLLGRRYFVRARARFDDLQASIHGLIRGIKELKLNDRKREAFFESVLMQHERSVQHNEKTGHTVIQAANNYGDLLSFFIIGSIIFILVNYRSISNEELVGVIMALLYITGPISALLHVIPLISVSRVSLQRVKRLFSEIPGEGIRQTGSPSPDWRSVRFQQVCYHHGNGSGKEDSFRVGPLDFEVKKGEVTFIVGGNGSGKSTMSKLLTLHYRAESGDILFGDTRVDDATIGACRQSISAIYSDYHLFDQLLGVDDDGLQAQVEHYLAALHLDRKVSYKDGRFSTLALSDGQRRRMALLSSIIDDKELYLFDEWAADQDPTFKSVFYNEILPSLRAQDKAVVAITHDDRYFDLADQLIVMEEGKVARIERRQRVQQADPSGLEAPRNFLTPT
ncbi:cyclic peptide export ABC transporter [Xanthomonas sp. GW]|uniref:cyclic peptide export ABC transporter n=1 Tax=Xanthomonas sp. GW TaxID=2724121 RepID=UPI00163A2865|nr:cyclic peptide export ABC transporter [Xanthomonas sp. GW]QNH20769.1 cyclic peptide export ABC transporter [Xanthomonas sp. GW]